MRPSVPTRRRGPAGRGGTWAETPFDRGLRVRIGSGARPSSRSAATRCVLGVGQRRRAVHLTSTDGLHWVDRGRPFGGVFPQAAATDGTTAVGLRLRARRPIAGHVDQHGRQTFQPPAPIPGLGPPTRSSALGRLAERPLDSSCRRGRPARRPVARRTGGGLGRRTGTGPSSDDVAADPSGGRPLVALGGDDDRVAARLDVGDGSSWRHARPALDAGRHDRTSRGSSRWDRRDRRAGHGGGTESPRSGQGPPRCLPPRRSDQPHRNRPASDDRVRKPGHANATILDAMVRPSHQARRCQRHQPDAAPVAGGAPDATRRIAARCGDRAARRPVRLAGVGPAVPRQEPGRADPDDLRIRRAGTRPADRPIAAICSRYFARWSGGQDRPPPARRGARPRPATIPTSKSSSGSPSASITDGLARRLRDLLRVRLARDQDGLTVPAEPDRDEVGRAVGADAAQPDDGLRAGAADRGGRRRVRRGRGPCADRGRRHARRAPDGRPHRAWTSVDAASAEPASADRAQRPPRIPPRPPPPRIPPSSPPRSGWLAASPGFGRLAVRASGG